MYRFLYFLMIILVPIVFGWWFFLPLAILFVYLTKLPYEIIIVGVILDSVYYFGESFLVKNQLTLFAVFLICLALFLSNKLDWRKVI